MIIPSKQLVMAEVCRRSFSAFFKYFAWPVLQPGTQYTHGWHVDAICQHLEAIKKGQIRKLVISMPFRMLKSSIVSQAFNAWDWIDDPSRQYLTASYAMDVATRDAVDSRRIIESPGYRAAYGDKYRLTSDQNVKTRYENDKRGSRTVTATEAAGTGFGGDVRIVDDPVSARMADSPIALKASVEWWRGTMATRANNPTTGRVIVVHQRMNKDDLTGYLLARESGWEHLCLPMRYDPSRSKITSIGYQDPRTKEGELLHPDRVDEAAAKELEMTLGSYHSEAQLNQNPQPRGGAILDRTQWQYYKELPSLDGIALSVDCSFKGGPSSDRVAIQAWGWSGARCYLLPGRIWSRLGFNATVQAVRNIRAANPKCQAILVEDKANGSAVVETLSTEVMGVIPIQPEGGKAARAYAVQPALEAGNLWIPDPSIDGTIEAFVGACASFTGADGGEDDEVDAMTQFVNWRRAYGRAGGGVAEYMRLEAERFGLGAI